MANYQTQIVILSLLVFKVLLYPLLPSSEGTNNLVKEDSVLRIGFGSCYDGLKKKEVTPERNILKDIVRENLDLWIWLGDFAYVDNRVLSGTPSLWEKLLHLVFKIPMSKAIYGELFGEDGFNSEESMRYLYNLTYTNEYYNQLRLSTPIVGVWDDHDYGVNDGDATYKNRVMQKQVFLDYMDEPQSSKRRLRGDAHGIYESYRVKKQGYSVLILLLDVRYENDPKIDSIISETQWSWLETELKASEDDLILIGSGVQFMLNNRLVNAEHWPASDVARLTQLAGTHLRPESKVVFLSGDVHHAQFTGSPCHLASLGGRSFIEVTTSGMTHTCDKNLFGLCRLALKGNTPPKFQQSPAIVDFNYGLITIDLNSLQADVAIKGRGQKTFIKQTLDQSPANAFKYCENHVFKKSRFVFEGLLMQVPTALIKETNAFLMLGITLLAGGLSSVSAAALWTLRRLR